MDVPGNVGLGIFGDESLELWRDAIGYFDKHVKEHGPVFVGRVLNKPTIFVTSSAAVKEMLCDRHECFTDGYREYMHGLFEDNIMFLEENKWSEARGLLEQIFSHENLHQSLDITKELLKDHIRDIPLKQPVIVYQHLKSLATQLSIRLFLSHTLSEAESRQVSELMTTHWHGIISLPVNMRLPLLPWRSGYGKALTAKDNLIKIIEEMLKSNKASPIVSALNDSTQSHDLAVRNILLFISALFPKAMASIMSTILLYLSKPENVCYLTECINNNELMMKCIILECQRLWPPFLGGRRICTKTCEINGYHIPEGHPVVYITYTANRDSTVFSEPTEFKPERWRDGTLDETLVWSFGGGPRCCIGRHLSTVILQEWLKSMVTSLSWQLSVNEVGGGDYKILPVIRPSDNTVMVFDERTNSDTQ